MWHNRCSNLRFHQSMEVEMKFGVALPHIGPGAGPQAIIEVAQKAESFGFDSVWALDRLLWPLHPMSKYPGNPRGELPAVMQIVYEPLTVLTFVAAHTQKVRLGTSVLVAAYRSPVLAAKIGATLDALSNGRLILGLGAGWSADEFTAANQSIEERDARTDEFIIAVRELWTANEPSFSGRYYRFPPSIFLPRPVQKPHPPIWIGGNSRRAVRRAAELGDGWHPTSRLNPTAFAEEVKYLRRAAEEAGRDPDRITLSLRWNALSELRDKIQIETVCRTLRGYRKTGVQHICFDLNIPQPRSLAAMLEIMERLKEIFVSFKQK
jgi:probable F420-dependent oxidoreductase